jgi:membrane dipeptidase
MERDAVIGMPLDAWMMVPNWVRGKSTPDNTVVTLNQMIDNMDHICQLAGNTNHVAIGTDLDGGFGTEQGPSDVDTIADLQKLTGLLSARGYSEADISAIFSENWLRKLRQL